MRLCVDKVAQLVVSHALVGRWGEREASKKSAHNEVAVKTQDVCWRNVEVLLVTGEQQCRGVGA